MELPAIMEVNSKDTFVYTRTTINRQIHLGFNTTIEVVSSTFHQIGSYRRVMRNLLEINRAAIDPALIGLTQNWVKRFLHGQVNE